MSASAVLESTDFQRKIFIVAPEDAAAKVSELRKFALAELSRVGAIISSSKDVAREPAVSAASEHMGRLASCGLPDGFVKTSLRNAASACGLVRDTSVKGVEEAITAGLKLGKKAPGDLIEVVQPMMPVAKSARPSQVSAEGADNETRSSPPPAEGGDRGEPPGPSSFDIDEVNRNYALAIWGGKAVVVNEHPCGPVNDRVRIMSFDSLNSWFANRYTEIRAADGKKKSVTFAKAWHQHRDRRQYEGVEFFPNPDGAASTPNYLNLWRGFSVTASEDGSCEKFKDHLRINVCQEDPALYRYLVGWMANLLQRPRDRAGIALILKGRKGTGKTKVGEVLGSLFAPHYFLVDDARYLTGQFNAHMASCLLLQADEAMWAGDKAAEGRLKGLITSQIQMVEAKGIDPIRMEDRVHIIMTSNEDWVVPASGDERRFFVLDVGSLCERNNIYFAEIDEELDHGGRARLLHELLSFDLKQFNIWDVPQTKALLDQKLGSLSPIDEFWHGRLYDGILIHGDEDWRAVVPRDELYGEYLKEVKSRNLGRARGTADFGKRLKKLVPAVRDTRPAIEKEPGVLRRTRCYEMPSLQECRESFEKHLGQPMSWPTLLPEKDQRLRSGEPHASDVTF